MWTRWRNNERQEQGGRNQQEQKQEQASDSDLVHQDQFDQFEVVVTQLGRSRLLSWVVVVLLIVLASVIVVLVLVPLLGSLRLRWVFLALAWVLPDLVWAPQCQSAPSVSLLPTCPSRLLVLLLVQG
jgi:Flp pilus assembly protein TadB